jgi:hypothetical protein
MVRIVERPAGMYLEYVGLVWASPLADEEHVLNAEERALTSELSDWVLRSMPELVDALEAAVVRGHPPSVRPVSV